FLLVQITLVCSSIFFGIHNYLFVHTRIYCLFPYLALNKQHFFEMYIHKGYILLNFLLLTQLWIIEHALFLIKNICESFHIFLHFYVFRAFHLLVVPINYLIYSAPILL